MASGMPGIVNDRSSLRFDKTTLPVAGMPRMLPQDSVPVSPFHAQDIRKLRREPLKRALSLFFASSIGCLCWICIERVDMTVDFTLELQKRKALHRHLQDLPTATCRVAEVDQTGLATAATSTM